MGNDGGVFHRLQYTGARGDMGGCKRKEGKHGGKENDKRGIGRRWKID